MSKLVIGTANFNQYYGVRKIKVAKKEINKILNTLKINKIKFIDTAIDYNISKDFFKLFQKSQFNVITKIKLPTKKKVNFIKNIPDLIYIESKKFKVNKIYGLLIHNVNDLKIKKYGKIFLKKILDLKKKKIISKIGVSIYNPKDLLLVFKMFTPDIVQLPINLFDQRFLKLNFLKNLKKKNILIHARSVFFQGLLLVKKNKIKNLEINKELKNRIIQFQDWCSKKKIAPLQACIQFLKHIKLIDNIVIGIENNYQLKSIIKAHNKEIDIKELNNFSLKNKNLIDPRKW